MHKIFYSFNEKKGEMEKSTDVIVIGSGIISLNISFELNKKGYKTINVDKHPASGYGSTSNSCACIRFI